MAETTRTFRGRPITSRDEERFWRLVEWEPNAGCALWTGSITRKGYGTFFHGDKKCVAHRFSMALVGSEIPDDMLGCHRCDQPACVNPAHIFAGSAAVNSADMRSKDRGNRGERNGQAALTEDDVVAIRLSTESAASLARAYGVRVGTIHKILRGYRWGYLGPVLRRPRRPARGAANSQSKLNDESVRDMRTRHAAGETGASIAKAFGVSQATASKILLGKGWTHVT